MEAEIENNIEPFEPKLSTKMLFFPGREIPTRQKRQFLIYILPVETVESIGFNESYLKVSSLAQRLIVESRTFFRLSMRQRRIHVNSAPGSKITTKIFHSLK